MREIKFRGKKTLTKEWVYGSLIIDKSNGTHTITQILENPVNDGILRGWCFGVIPETVGQYTGLKDKEGKEIYEGDILKVCQQGGHIEYDEIKVVYNEKYACSMLESANDLSYYVQRYYYFEVIANPEIL